MKNKTNAYHKLRGGGVGGADLLNKRLGTEAPIRSNHDLEVLKIPAIPVISSIFFAFPYISWNLKQFHAILVTFCYFQPLQQLPATLSHLKPSSNFQQFLAISSTFQKFSAKFQSFLPFLAISSL